MKKFLLSLSIVALSTISVSAASYKINSSGKVTTPTNKVQNTQNSKQTISPNYINNYYTTNYIPNSGVAQSGVQNIDIVMDYSGSMQNWINIAKNSMEYIISQLPSNIKIGFRAFGHDNGNNAYDPIKTKIKSIVKNKKGGYKVSASLSTNLLGNCQGGCSATQQLLTVAHHNANQYKSAMNSIDLGGSTPLTLALSQAVNKDFAGFDQISSKRIILITDGGENCGGNPCAFAKNLMAARKDIRIDVVLVSAASHELKCLASETGGKVYTTNSLNTFVNTLQNALQQDIPSNTNQQNQGNEQNQYYEFISD